MNASVLYQSFFIPACISRTRISFRPLMSFTQARCDDKHVDRTVEEAIEKFHQSMEKKNEDKGLIFLSFYVVEKKSRVLGFFQSEEKIYWEVRRHY